MRTAARLRGLISGHGPAAAVAGLLAVVLTVVATTAAAVLLSAVPGSAETDLRASDTAERDIPAPMLELYRSAAATCPGLPWTVLAGVGWVETRHGAVTAVSTAGALGPMQFLPATWGQYGLDASGDGRSDIADPADAVFGAARMLCANGAGRPGGLRGALWAYNHAAWYVDLVLATAEGYAVREALAPAPELTALLEAPGLVLTDAARRDLASGRVDGRVVRVLAELVRFHAVSVSVLASGHAPFVEGTNRLSHHVFGRAVDVYAIDGEPVGPASEGARRVVERLLALDGADRADEVGHPFPDLVAPCAFTDASHLDHIHIGFAP